MSGKTELQTVSIRISVDVYRRMVEVADEQDRTIRSAVDMACNEFLDRRAKALTDKNETTASFRRGLSEALAGEARPISELWASIDDDDDDDDTAVSQEAGE